MKTRNDNVQHACNNDHDGQSVPAPESVMGLLATFSEHTPKGRQPPLQARRQSLCACVCGRPEHPLYFVQGLPSLQLSSIFSTTRSSSAPAGSALFDTFGLWCRGEAGLTFDFQVELRAQWPVASCKVDQKRHSKTKTKDAVKSSLSTRDDLVQTPASPPGTAPEQQQSVLRRTVGTKYSQSVATKSSKRNNKLTCKQQLRNNNSS